MGDAGGVMAEAREQEGRLGLIVSGSLVKGLTARLDGGTSVEELRVGRFVRIRGQRHDFFCLVTDVRLDATTPDVQADPPAPEEGFLRAVLAGTTAYGAVEIQPMLMLDREGADGPDVPANGRANGHGGGASGAGLAAERPEPRPVRTVPAHFSEVFLADDDDFKRVFGEADRSHFEIGQPLEGDHAICVDLRRFVERSNGVFGKSGTGKSFLTRLLLCGVALSKEAVNLIFDMHSEYGWASQSESGYQVKGLRQLFGGSRVAVYTLDPDTPRDGDARHDGAIVVGLNEIEIEDIALLQEELRLNPTAVESANICEDRLGKRWIEQLTSEDVDVAELAANVGANAASLGALRNKLRAHLLRLKFVRPHVTEADSGLDKLIASLLQGQHVVLEFGQHRNLLAYMLAANVITRRIHARWTKMTEDHKQGRGEKPRQLMITIEEAHKFLNPRAASQTIFGTIARELRKYNVTLLVVDQRPSGIDDEVLSQIGTRITCQLNDDRDIDAVLAGMSGAGHLRSVLATLDSRQQAMILGHAVPMPMALRTRPYDEAFYQFVEERRSGLGGLAPVGAAAVPAWGPDPIRRAVENAQSRESREAKLRRELGMDDE
jgi:uncharacterized protein